MTKQKTRGLPPPAPLLTHFPIPRPLPPPPPLASSLLLLLVISLSPPFRTSLPPPLPPLLISPLLPLFPHLHCSSILSFLSRPSSPPLLLLPIPLLLLLPSSLPSHLSPCPTPSYPLSLLFIISLILLSSPFNFSLLLILHFSPTFPSSLLLPLSRHL